MLNENCHSLTFNSGDNGKLCGSAGTRDRSIEQSEASYLLLKLRGPGIGDPAAHIMTNQMNAFRCHCVDCSR